MYLYLGVYKMYLGVYKDVTSLVSDSAYNLKTYPDPGFFLTLPEMLSNFVCQWSLKKTPRNRVPGPNGIVGHNGS